MSARARKPPAVEFSMRTGWSGALFVTAKFQGHGATMAIDAGEALGNTMRIEFAKRSAESMARDAARRDRGATRRRPSTKGRR